MAAVIAIDDPDDPRIAGYRAVRERDLIGREGLFVAEGEVVLRRLAAASSRFAPVSLLMAQKRVEGLADLLAQWPADTPVYAASQPVMDAIAGFHIHRGLLALGRRVDPPAADALLAGLPARALVVAMFGLSNHDNVGGVFRNAAAFGADAVILDAGCCDPLYRKAIRVSVGGVFCVPFARLAADEDAVSLFARHGFDAVALSPGGARALGAVIRADRTVLMLGAEGPGLPADLLARARTVRIPMAPGFDSLNVAAASAVALHHLAFGV